MRTSLTSLSDADKAELNARLCAVRVVSWEWNEAGRKVHAEHNLPIAPPGTPVIGVVAQEVQEQLASYFPEIVLTDEQGNLMVDYPMLARLAVTVLEYLRVPDLDKLLEKYQTSDQQLYATRMLALVHRHNEP